MTNTHYTLSRKVSLAATAPSNLAQVRDEALKSYRMLEAMTDDLGGLYASSRYRDLLKTDPAEAARLDRVKMRWNNARSALYTALASLNQAISQSK